MTFRLDIALYVDSILMYVCICFNYLLYLFLTSKNVKKSSVTQNSFAVLHVVDKNNLAVFLVSRLVMNCWLQFHNKTE